MTPTLRTLRALDVAAGIALLGAMAGALWPVRISVHAPIANATCCGQKTPSPVMDSSVDANVVVAANILSASRRAPGTRYVSPDAQAQTPYTAPAAFAVPVARDSSGESADTGDSVPSVYGIMSMDGTWRALVRLTTADANPVLLKEGDTRGTYRVVNISADRVIVAGPGGQHMLKLSRAQRADSTRHKP